MSQAYEWPGHESATSFVRDHNTNDARMGVAPVLWSNRGGANLRLIISALQRSR